jgi:rubrerythrin
VQLLAGKGFKDVYNLKGGIMAWQGLTTAGPADMGMSFLKGDEAPEEIIVLAYGMEKGLGRFYALVSRQTDDKEVADLLTILSDVEELHKKMLFNLYLSIDPTVSDTKTFELKIVSDVMEGGFTTEEFLEKNKPTMQTVPGVLNIAMMLETQAMDLYLRYSQKIEEERSKKVLYDIAEEEKAHLGSLGRLLEIKG